MSDSLVRNCRNGGLKPQKGREVKFRLGLIIGLFLIIQFLSGTSKVNADTTINFTGGELLGKPTDTSITINIIPDSDIEYYYEYGTSSGDYSDETDHYVAIGGEAHEITISGLNPNTEYFYRMQYNYASSGWVICPEYSFFTQRDQGETFVFAVTSDSHANYNTTYQNSINQIRDDHPDFLIDLGDTFMVDADGSQSAVDAAYLLQRSSLYLGGVGTSSAIFLSSGNHEEEEGWNLDDTPFSAGVGSIQARKMYYPTPVDDGFYTGNTDPLAAIDESLYGDELREDYYAWEWGDALFVVIDPFQYTMNLPYSPIAGEASDDPVDGDQWSWTLGDQQYQWLIDVLQGSNAKYKFIFSHQMVGGIPDNNVSGGAGYVRGGAEAAGYFEWGGLNANGTEGFSTHRAEVDFGTTPIHQLFVETGVSAYFHGHDHQFVYETRDGVVYQEVPSPTMTGSGFPGIYTEGNFGDYQTIEILPNAGYLQVTVDPDLATVKYVSSGGSINYTYTIEPNEIGTGTLGDVNGDGYANSSDALMILSGDVGIAIPNEYCPMACGDVDGNGFVNSTDALIILTYDAGFSVSYSVGQPGCPTTVTPCSGCVP